VLHYQADRAPPDMHDYTRAGNYVSGLGLADLDIGMCRSQLKKKQPVA